MKRIFITLVCALFSLSMSGQELILPCAPNSDSTLRYTFKVVSDKYPDDAARLERQMAHYFKGIKRAITPSQFGAEFSDFNIDIKSDDIAIVDDSGEKFTSDANLLSLCVSRIGMKYRSRSYADNLAPVFRAKEGGYDNFRIPSIVAMPNGRVVAFAEARAFNKDQANNNIVAKYSDNHGDSWSELIVIDNQGQASLNNPCTVVHGKRIMMLYNCYPPGVTEGNLKLENRMQRNYYVYSDDGGQSWSAPRDITAQTMHPLAVSACSGPGAAIVVDGGPYHGRIVVPFNGNGNSRWFNYIVYSDDNGNNWHIANGLSYYGTNESQIVQLTDTTFLVSARSHRNIGDKSYMAPEGWNPWDFSKVTRNRAQIYVTMRGDSIEWGAPEIRADLPDPTCQGSIVRAYDGALYMSNPASAHTHPIEGRPYAQTSPMRVNGMLNVSYDEGKSWSDVERIYGGRFTEFQYSALAAWYDGVYCLFETFPNIRLTYIPTDGVFEGSVADILKQERAELRAFKEALRVR